jgi:hypothetical protein
LCLNDIKIQAALDIIDIFSSFAIISCPTHDTLTVNGPPQEAFTPRVLHGALPGVFPGAGKRPEANYSETSGNAKRSSIVSLSSPSSATAVAFQTGDFSAFKISDEPLLQRKFSAPGGRPDYRFHPGQDARFHEA